MLSLLRKNSKKILSSTIAVLAIALFIWYFFTHINDFSLLLNINPLFVMLLVVISVLSIVSNGIFVKWSISLFDKYINTSESVRVSLISSAGNFFAPAGSGLGFRGIYLKRRHGLAYSDYISILFCNYVIVFFVVSFLGLISLFVLSEHTSPSFFALTALFTALFVASISAFFIRVKSKEHHKRYKLRWAQRLSDVIYRISKGWSLVLSNKKVALGLVSLVIFNMAITIAGSYFIMMSLGISIPFAGLLLFSVLGSLSVFINITPGNLGIKEAVYVVFSATIGLTTTQILSVALIDRTVTFAVLFILWLGYGRDLRLSSGQDKRS